MSFIDFLSKYGRLKRVPRTGWLLRGVSLGDVESVADHTSRTSVISMIVSQCIESKGIRLDKGKILEMSLLHDLAEAVIFDVDQEVSELIGKNLKRNAEHSAEHFLLQELPNKFKKRYTQLLDELHKGKTLEARIVKTADKLEMIFQSIEYSNKYSKKILNKFYQEIYKIEDFTVDEIQKFIQQLKDLIKE